MSIQSILTQIAHGEDSTHQFKADVRNGESLAAEMVAFANSAGGTLFIGVADDGSTPGLAKEDVARINQLISNAASREGCLFTSTVHRNAPSNAPSNAPINAPINAPMSDLQRQLLKLVQSNPHASYDQLAVLTQKDRTTIMRNMAKLKAASRVQRVGPAKGGHWQVIE